MHFIVLVLLINCCFSLVIHHTKRDVLPHSYATFSYGKDIYNVSGAVIKAIPYHACGVINVDVKDMIVLEERYGEKSGCSYYNQSYTVQQYGGIGVIIVDSEYRQQLLVMTRTASDSRKELMIPSVFIYKETGDYLLSLLENKTDFYVTLDIEGELTAYSVAPWKVVSIIYEIALLIVWISSIVYFSDHCIVKRIIKRRENIYKRIKPISFMAIKTKKYKGVQEYSGSLSNKTLLQKKTGSVIVPIPESEDVCSVCLESFKPLSIVKCLPCHHYFHVHCIDEWTKINMICPICRQSIYTIDDHLRQATSYEDELIKEINHQQCIYLFWRDFMCINIVIFVLITW